MLSGRRQPGGGSYPKTSKEKNVRKRDREVLSECSVDKRLLATKLYSSET